MLDELKSTDYCSSCICYEGIYAELQMVLIERCSASGFFTGVTPLPKQKLDF